MSDIELYTHSSQEIILSIFSSHDQEGREGGGSLLRVKLSEAVEFEFEFICTLQQYSSLMRAFSCVAKVHIASATFVLSWMAGFLFW